MNKRGSAELAVVLVAVIVLLVGGIWYYKAHQTLPIQLSSSSPHNATQPIVILSESQAANLALSEIASSTDNFTGLPADCLSSSPYETKTSTLIFKIQTIQSSNCKSNTSFPFTYFAKVDLTTGEVYYQPISTTTYDNYWLLINPPSIQTSTWKTYSDSNLQFEMQYPDDWQFTQNSTTNQLTLWLTSPIVYDLRGYESQGSRYRIGLDVTDNQVSLDQTTSFVDTSGTVIQDYSGPLGMGIYGGSNIYYVGQAILSSAGFYGYASTTAVTISNPGQSTLEKYMSTDYGFSIEVPNNLTAYSDGDLNLTFRTPVEEKAWDNVVASCANSGHPGVCASGDTDFAIGFTNGYDFDYPNWVKGDEVVINGIAWKKLYDNVDYGDNPPIYEYVISDGGNYYNFYASNEQLLQEVLSTFKLAPKSN